MRSFSRIRERIDDVRMSKPLLVGVVKLLLVTMIILNILGGAWCVLFLTLQFMQGCCSVARTVAWRAVLRGGLLYRYACCCRCVARRVFFV